MKLFYSPNSVAVASAITLQEAGLPYELARVDFAKAAQTTPEYLSINPKARVPALATDQGILTETGAILEYIAALTPKAGLMPTEPWAAAQTRAIMGYLGSTMHVAHAHGARGARWATEQSALEDMRAMVPQTMTACCTYLEENAFGDGPYVMGASMTLADPWLYAISLWLKGDGVILADFPKLTRFTETMAQRDSVRVLRKKGVIK